jgi:hypothetical protein
MFFLVVGQVLYKRICQKRTPSSNTERKSLWLNQEVLNFKFCQKVRDQRSEVRGLRIVVRRWYRKMAPQNGAVEWHHETALQGQAQGVLQMLLYFDVMLIASPYQNSREISY